MISNIQKYGILYRPTFNTQFSYTCRPSGKKRNVKKNRAGHFLPANTTTVVTQYKIQILGQPAFEQTKLVKLVCDFL